MTFSTQDLWKRFQKHYSYFPSLDLGLDLSRMLFPDDFFTDLGPRLDKAFQAMTELESGAVSNPDEDRMVGHYWLRNPALAPTPEIRSEIEKAQADIAAFAAGIHTGKIRVANSVINNVLVIGIGGSALGPQFVAHALGHHTRDRVRMSFLDNTDPDGFDRVLAGLRDQLSATLVIVISKSGGTKETRNGMLEARAAFERAGLHFPLHAVAVTGRDSELDKLAAKEGWMKRFPMWDWVGGRTSVTSAVGLLPAALQGIDTAAMLRGAAACDEITRLPGVARNPAAQLAAMWFYSGGGKGLKDMVVIPYKDRLELFSRYLQQLVMESLGKEKDLSGSVSNQGLAVYGNKGSTDQHAYIQQLREGLNNFFVTFVRVLKDREGASFLVDSNATSGDYLDGFLLGTRRALIEKGRESITITVREVSPFTVGALIALFERAVGFYASIVGINAYHQPGVEAGKKAAGKVLDLQGRILDFIRSGGGRQFTLEEVVSGVSSGEDPESVFHVLEHLSTNPDRGIQKAVGQGLLEARYKLS